MKWSFVVSLFLGLVLGCVVGLSVAKAFVQSRWIMDASLATEHYATMQYQHSDAEHSRQALIFSAQFYDDLVAVTADSRRMHGFGAGLSYGRLALLEEKAENNEQSRAYFEKAQQRFKAAHKNNNDCNEGCVRELVQKFGGIAPH